jgi:hypothetical protein
LDDNKKPGGRDISDLKARLGLKKTGVMQAVTPSGAPQTPQAPQAGAPAPIPSPIAPPPTAAAQKAIPSPFGQPEAPPQPAAPPDPRRDPFAMQQAANLAAFYGIGQALPGSTEGVSAEPLSKPKPWGMIGLLTLVGALVFGVGNACGRIYQSRAEFNMTIDQAGQIRTEVEKLSRNLNNIADTINASKLTQQGQPDFELASQLGSLDLAKPDTQKIFHTNYMHFEDPAIERLFNYYNHTIVLYEAITQHAKKTDADRASIESYMKSGGDHKADKNYGIVLDLSGALPLAKFAELGAPVCPNPEDTNCPPAQLKGFKFRFDSGGSWGEKPIHGNPKDTVTPIEPSALFKTIAAGNPDILAYKDYLRRVVTIKAMAGSLVAEQKDVLGDLKKTTERPKVFVF